MTLLLYTNHNYYNRKIERYDNPQHYIEAWGNPIYINNISFIVQDGVRTSQIVNYDTNYYPELSSGQTAPSYCIVVNDRQEIISRWWVLESVITRRGQANLSLLRDVIADYWDVVMNCPSFVKKGFVSVNDTAIFNNEEMAFNQIKTTETAIKDITKSAWYVGYLNKTLTSKKITIPKNPNAINGQYSNYAAYPYHQYASVDTPFIYEYQDLTFKLFAYGSLSDGIAIGWDKNGALKFPQMDIASQNEVEFGVSMLSQKIGYRWKFGYVSPITKVKASIKDNIAGYNWMDGLAAITNIKTASQLALLEKEVGKIYQIGDEYISPKIRQITYKKNILPENSNIYVDKFKQLAASSDALTDEVSGSICGIELIANAYVLEYEKVPVDEIEYQFPTSNQQCYDAPFDMFAIPADPVKFKKVFTNDGTSITRTFTSDPEISRRFVEQIINTYSGGEGATRELYDVQLVPYCPLPELYLTDNEVLTSTFPENVQPETRYWDEIGYQTFIVFPSHSNFSKQVLDYTINVPSNAEDFKVANECDKYRLCSPNYNGQFEFSATKNGGVRGWNISFTYKPYNPYIKVSPMFGRLYGEDFGDARGLICGGDFSLSLLSDAWETYELQNKNYLNIFDRQITNMEINNSVQRIQERVNAFSGTVMGAAQGGMVGGTMGGPWGAAIGAIAGGVASAAGGIADVSLNERLRNEALSYTKDMFGYNLQNIQAMPQSLSRVSGIVVDNKIFPFVEYYTCSDIEKQALRDKIKWNGMTIMRAGAIKDFLLDRTTESGTFIQAQPIRLEMGYYGEEAYSFDEDSHVADTINIELQSGVYII